MQSRTNRINQVAHVKWTRKILKWSAKNILLIHIINSILTINSAIAKQITHFIKLGTHHLHNNYISTIAEWLGQDKYSVLLLVNQCLYSFPPRSTHSVKTCYWHHSEEPMALVQLVPSFHPCSQLRDQMQHSIHSLGVQSVQTQTIWQPVLLELILLEHRVGSEWSHGSEQKLVNIVNCKNRVLN